MKPLWVGITADDLTGAADTAAALARPGAPVSVSLDLTPKLAEVHTVFAVTTETRSSNADTAHRLVAESAKLLKEAGAELIYKKVDSNLRGNVGPELAAVCEVVGGGVVLAPAFPARGRTVIDGLALVHGTPVAETEMARDPQAPVRESNLLAWLRAQRPDLTVAHCPLSVVRGGGEAVRHRIPGAGVLVVDAETEADLDAVAGAALSLSPPPALAGSAGLAAAVARQMWGRPARPVWPAGSAGPVLAVLASGSELLRFQVEQAAVRLGVRAIPLPCERLSRAEGPAPELEEVIQQAGAELAAGRDAIVHATGRLPAAERPVELVVEHLAHVAFALVGRARPAALLVGGGATAGAVLGALDARGIEVDDEPLPGIAAGTPMWGHFHGRPMVLKPGAAGEEGAVAGLLVYLRQRAAAAEA
jgi:uncharacterized protein YgbK (DUF1537 family)